MDELCLHYSLSPPNQQQPKRPATPPFLRLLSRHSYTVTANTYGLLCWVGCCCPADAMAWMPIKGCYDFMCESKKKDLQ